MADQRTGSSPEDYAASPRNHLEIQICEQADGAQLLILRGEVDIEAGPTLESALRGAEDGRSSRVVVDLSEVEFIDSTGIRVLVEARLRAARENRDLVLANLSTNVERVFALTGISAQFTITM